MIEVFDQLDVSPGRPSKLTGLGKLPPGTTFGLRLQGARPHALVGTEVGSGHAQVPFAGGVLVPTPDIVGQTTTDAHDNAAGYGLWSPGCPAFSPRVSPARIRDPVAPFGCSASNGLQAMTGLGP